MSLRTSLRAAIEERCPALFVMLLQAKAWLFPDRGEPERRLVPLLCHPAELAIDVGANHGAYSVLMIRHAGGLLAAEPNPRLADVLRRRLGAAIQAGRATVWQGALSDHEGRSRLFIPTGRSALASVEAEAGTSYPGRHEEITLRRIDDLDLPRTGFIKIDVEGHEASVLAGARRLLERDRPNLLVEVEDRHRPGSLAAIRALLEPLAYRGFFLLDGRLQPIERFDARLHQDRASLDAAGERPLPGRTYVANFVFAAREDVIGRLQCWPG